MKKIIFIIISSILFFCSSSCSGYKPIYSSSNFNFKIEDHSIKGDERLGNLIYRKLYSISLSNDNNPAAQSIILSIEAWDCKTVTRCTSSALLLFRSAFLRYGLQKNFGKTILLNSRLFCSFFIPMHIF